MSKSTIEEGIIGTFLNDSSLFFLYQDFLSEDHFLSNENQILFRAMNGVGKQAKSFDIIIITHWLKENHLLAKAGGAYTVTIKTSSAIYNSSNLEYWIRILHQEYVAREIESMALRMHADIRQEEKDILAIMSKYWQEFDNKLMSLVRKRSIPSVNAIIETSFESKEESIPSGFKTLDNVIVGLHKSDLIVIAARPGVGKTSFALQLAHHAAVSANTPVYFASLEMKATQLMQRMMSFIMNIENQKFRKKELTSTDKSGIQMIGRALNDKIIVDDDPQQTITSLKASLRRAKLKHNIGLVVIDYLQLMEGDKGGTHREQEVSQISRGLKLIAKELDIPVVALSQLNRSAEARKDKKPGLSDLRESGAIEQDADQVLFIYRPDYHGFSHDASGAATDGKVKIIIAKNRHGSLTEIDLLFDANYTKFYSPTVPESYNLSQTTEENDNDDPTF